MIDIEQKPEAFFKDKGVSDATENGDCHCAMMAPDIKQGLG